MQPDSDERGKILFDAMTLEDKRAIKRFMTGQIQNVLANEYGFTHSNIQASVKTMVGKGVESAIQERLTTGGGVEAMIVNIMTKNSLDMVKIVEKIAADMAKKALAERFNEAAREITFTVQVNEQELSQVKPPSMF